MVQEPGGLFPENPGCLSLKGGPFLAPGHPAMSKRPERPLHSTVTEVLVFGPLWGRGEPGLQALKIRTAPLSHTRWLAHQGPAGGLVP